MDLVGVRIELPTNTPILLLREQAPNPRLLPIFIGAPEATAIALALEGVEVPRPMTHDLIKVILEHMGVALLRVLVTELRDKTFFAELELGENGQTRNGCRAAPPTRSPWRCAAAPPSSPPRRCWRTPATGSRSDAEESEDDESEEAETDPDEVVEQFREFIDTVRPEDFES